jgi:Predicted soluble lytic transglycosylase fused to an ABC-type amino acid-binding protein
MKTARAWVSKSPASRLVRLALVVAVGVAVARGAEEEAEESEGISLDALYETGRALFDQFAPAEIKEQFEFPTKEQWDEFAGRLNGALQDEDLAGLAEYLPDAKAALVALRALPGYEDYAVWLQERIDYIEAAKEAAAGPESEPEVTKKEEPAPVRPKDSVPSPAPKRVAIPHYELWLERMIERPMPPNAGKLLPVVRAAFEAEGVAPEIAWLAEAESTFNPNAKSPVGAKGLFQFMPETAKGLGLSTFMPDERTHPEKSARAAAKYLRELYGKFGDWPLAFAAYNAGEGRVRRLLKKHEATTFAGIASALPSETRMYVPKVCATIAVRAGMTPERIPAPRSGGRG